MPAIEGRAEPGKVICFVVEAAECFEPAALASSIRTLADLSSHIPVVAVICLATAVTAIPDMLPSSLAERLSIETFRLDSAKERLDVLVEKMLLARELPPIVLGPTVCALVEEYILHYDYSVHALLRALQLAVLEHYHPDSAKNVLVPAMAQLRSARAAPDIVNRMSTAQRDELQRCLADEHTVDASARRTPTKHLQALCDSFDREWLSWTTAVKLVYRVTSVAVPASRDTDHPGLSFPLWRIWALASRTSDAFTTGEANRQIQHILSKAMHALRILDEATLMGIMLAWQKALNEIRGSKGKALIVLENRVKKKLNEVTKRRQQQATVQAECDDPNAESRATVHDATVPNGPLPRQDGRAEPTTTTPRATATRASAAPTIIRGTGTNARRRGELLHQFVANVSSASHNPRRQHGTDPARRVLERRGGGGVETAPAFGLGQWLAEELATVSKLLVSPVERFPLMRTLLCFDDADAIRGMLLPDPRTSVMRALSRPAAVLGCTCCPSQDGALTKTMEDACIAYGLLNEQGGSHNLYDWFIAFCRVYGDTKVGRVVRKSRGRRNRPASKEAVTSMTPQTALQARFTRAVAELQLLGLFKSGRHSRAEHVTRLIFTIEPGEEDDA